MEDEKEELSPTSTLASCKNKCEAVYWYLSFNYL